MLLLRAVLKQYETKYFQARPDILQLFYSLTSSHNVFEDNGYWARRERILSPTPSRHFHRLSPAPLDISLSLQPSPVW